MSKQDPRYEQFRNLMRDLRKEQDVTQQELAALLGKPQSYVSKYESGERNVDLVELVDIVKALGLEPVKSMSNLLKSLEN